MRSIFLDAENQRRLKAAEVSVRKNRNTPYAHAYPDACRVTISNDQFRLSISVEIALHYVEVPGLAKIGISAPGAERFTILLDDKKSVSFRQDFADTGAIAERNAMPLLISFNCRRLRRTDNNQLAGLCMYLRGEGKDQKES